MANKFEGTIDELKEKVEQAGISGDWEDDGNGKHTFRDKRGVLNWWSSTGTINFQGSSDAKARLEAVFEDSTEEQSFPDKSSDQAPPSSHKQIFIVHGHDEEARDQLELALHRLGLEPFVLMNTSSGGKTIIEALEGEIGRDYTSDFGIVLMTPDDYGHSQKEGTEKGEPRARQNVILETGMLFSSLTRERMAIIVKGHLEIPSDIAGLIRLPYNQHIKEIIPKLCQRLEEAGFAIDSNLIASAAQ